MTEEADLAPQAELGRLQWVQLHRPAPPPNFDPGALGRELAALASERLKPGQRVGIGVGSRGISGLAGVVGQVVKAVRDAGADPVLLPAMGSHGGATSAGQVEVLEALGVSEDLLGVPIDAAMEAVAVGSLAGGYPVYTARSALACDAVVPVNRVKPHTDFRADVESGLTKMLTIGLGKELGASTLHRAGFTSFGRTLPEAVQVVRSALNVPFGVALLEDAWHRLHRAEVVPGEEVAERDAQLLTEAWKLFGHLPFAEVDVLILKEMGKTISGAGMDPNVTGRFAVTPPLPSPTSTQCLVVLDLTEGSAGNAIGVGMADVVTERLRAKIDWAYTYANARASKALSGARLPMVAANDAEAIGLALASVVAERPRQFGVVAAANTLEVNDIAVSGPLVAEAEAAGYQRSREGLTAELGPDGRLDRIGDMEFFGREGAGQGPGER